MAERRCKRRPFREGTRPSDVITVFFSIAVLYVAAALVVALLSSVLQLGTAPWLVLHLIFVGAISQLVIGAAQFFAGAFLASGPPPRWLVRSELLLWNLGTLTLLVGRLTESAPAIAVGSALLLLGLAAFSFALRGLRQQSLQRYPWATRWYQACAVCLGLGTCLGTVLALGGVWTAGDLLSAHITLNLAGWFGTAIVGTLHTFYPSLSGGELWRPKLQSATFTLWCTGVVALAVGFAFDLLALEAGAVITMLGGASLLGLNVAMTYTGGSMRRTLVARIVGAAQLFLVAALTLVLVSLLASGRLVPEARSAAGALLIAGWLGPTVLGSLIRLLTVVGRVRSLPAAPRSQPALPGERAIPWALTLSLVVSALGLLLSLDWLAAAGAVAAAVVYLDLLGLVARLTWRAVKVAPLRL